ncbi:phage portal protein [Allorhizobium undicola]|uniref:phage portal protein n=1 Tax=Allorhizobium undicola TaxID=78527 RepID=UPI003D331985
MNWLRGLGAMLGGGPRNATQQKDGGREYGVRDPRFLEAVRAAMDGTPGGDVMRNGAVNRAVRLHCESIGMLPLHLNYQDESKGKAVDHPLFSVLHRTPNNWQTPYEFKRLMQAQLLKNGVAYAQIVRSRGRVLQLQPLAKFHVQAKQNQDWSLTYELTNRNGTRSTLRQDEILAIRDLDLSDGVVGQSKLEQAKGAVLLSASINKAVQKLFDNNMMAGGSLQTDVKLSSEVRASIRQSLEERSGPDMAGKWLLLEEGLKANPFKQTLEDSQQVENLRRLIEEIARIFGVPRPLLMMDETSWGSGIEALALFFVQYCLAPQFVNWEQAIYRDCLTEAEKQEYMPKFNERALLRGSMKDQAEFLSKALGSGGGRAWMTPNEARSLSEMANIDGGDELPQPTTTSTGAATNVTQKPA